MRRPVGPETTRLGQRARVPAIGLHAPAARRVHRCEVRIGDDDLVAEGLERLGHSFTVGRRLQQNARARPRPEQGGEALAAGAHSAFPAARRRGRPRCRSDCRADGRRCRCTPCLASLWLVGPRSTTAWRPAASSHLHPGRLLGPPEGPLAMAAPWHPVGALCGMPDGGWAWTVVTGSNPLRPLAPPRGAAMSSAWRSFTIVSTDTRRLGCSHLPSSRLDTRPGRQHESSSPTP
jgi:hypothetical protein